MLIASIAILNLMGVSYAYWDNGLNVATTVHTGNMDIVFGDQRTLMRFAEDKGLNIAYEDEGRTMVVEGTVDANNNPVTTVTEDATDTEIVTTTTTTMRDYKGTLDFNIANNSIIPAELSSPGKRDINGERGSCTVELNRHLPGELGPEESYASFGEDPQLQINAGEGAHEFEVEFLFRQKGN